MAAMGIAQAQFIGRVTLPSDKVLDILMER